MEVAVPAASKVRRAVKGVHFCDAYQAPLSRAMSVEDASRAIFGHASSLGRALMTVRGWMVRPFGLLHPTREQMRAGEENRQRLPLRVGERVGIFTVHSIEPQELIAGEDDRHLDFRVSVFKAADGATVTLSTVVHINNLLGRVYIALIKPFHKLIVRSMLQNAVDAGRL
jgi:hypothetical protein